MPSFDMDEEDMKHAISALPFTGAVTGLLSYGAYKGLILMDIPLFPLMLILSLIPLIITGGFHLDGFMDVEDALASCRPKEKKLEIMKDPHIGAFAVIAAAVYGMIWAASLYILLSKPCDGYVYIYMSSFFVIRALCGLTCTMFEKAKKEGMLHSETDAADSRDRLILFVFSVSGLLLFMYFDLMAGALCSAALILFTFIYKRRCQKEFGGITGDTAGYYICTGEALVLVCLSIIKTALMQVL